MNRELILERANCSDRVRSLLATAIMVSARRELNIDLSAEDARDLARSHTITTALTHLRDRLQTHQQIPNPRIRGKLAVLEAKIGDVTGGLVGAEKLTRIVAARKETLATLERQSQLGDHTRSELLRLLAVRDEVAGWGRSYSYFLRELGRIYADRMRQVAALQLAPERRTEVEEEIEQIIDAAIHESVD